MPLIEPLESREVTKISEFVIVIDTSYSTNGPLVQKFLEETFQIIQERDSFFHKSQIRIIQCDNQVHSDTIIKEQRDIPKLLHNFELIGGGGTDFRPAFSYINKLLENGEFQNYCRFLGRTKVIVVPTPGSLSSSTLPLWNSTPCLTMESPSPVPPISLEWLLSAL